MNTLRRVYFYLISAIALEGMIWGGVQLLRLTTDLAPQGESLAAGLATVLVSALVFWLHWRFVQERVQTDEEERNSWERAVFLYGMMILTLVPCVQAVIRMAGRGEGDLWALPFNLLTAWYLGSVLRADWKMTDVGEARQTVRRWAVYFWLVYGLIWMSAGLYRLLTLLVGGLFEYFVGQSPRYGLVSLLAGGAIWGSANGQLMKWMRQQPEERIQTLRQGVFFLVEFSAGVTVLSVATIQLADLLQRALGGQLAGWLGAQYDTFPALLLALLLWSYHRHQRQRDAAAFPRERTVWATAIRENLYLAIGYGMALAGALRAAGVISHLVSGGFPEATALSQAIVWLVVGGWLWWALWRQLPFWPLRRLYLYLYVFVGTLGLMVSAGDWLRNLFLLVFAGARWADTWPALLRGLLQGGVFGGTFFFHLRALRQETAQADAAARRWSDLRVYISPGAEDAGRQLAPLGVQRVTHPAEAEIAILSAEEVEAASAWPEETLKLVLPALPRRGWVWLQAGKRETALRALPTALRRILRGETPPTRTRPVWLWVVYIFAALFALQWGLALILTALDGLL